MSFWRVLRPNLTVKRTVDINKLGGLLESTTITPDTNADYTLTDEENEFGRLNLVDGSWLAGHSIIVNSIGKEFTVDNSAGTYDALVTTELGTGITVLAGCTTKLYDNGTNIIYQEHGIGTNQEWQDVTASRSSGVVYTNTTGKPIHVSAYTLITASAARELSLEVDGIIVQYGLLGTGVSTGSVSVDAIVSDGSTYEITYQLIDKWRELR